MVKAEKKKCKDCKVLKCTSEFYTRKKNMKTGLKIYIQSCCKACTNKRKADWNKANRARYNKGNRERRRHKKLGIKRKPIQTHEERMAYMRKYQRSSWNRRNGHPRRSSASGPVRDGQIKYWNKSIYNSSKREILFLNRWVLYAETSVVKIVIVIPMCIPTFSIVIVLTIVRVESYIVETIPTILFRGSCITTNTPS